MRLELGLQSGVTRHAVRSVDIQRGAHKPVGFNGGPAGCPKEDGFTQNRRSKRGVFQ